MTGSSLVRLGVLILAAFLLIGKIRQSICTGLPWPFTLGKINSVLWVGRWPSHWLTTCWPPRCRVWSRTEVISCVATQCMLPIAPLSWWWLFAALATVTRDRHSNVQQMTAFAKNGTHPGRPLFFGAQCILWLWISMNDPMIDESSMNKWNLGTCHCIISGLFGLVSTLTWWQWLNEWKWESNLRFRLWQIWCSDPIHNLWHGVAAWGSESCGQGDVASTSKTCGSKSSPGTSTRGEAWGVCQVGSTSYTTSPIS